MPRRAPVLREESVLGYGFNPTGAPAMVSVAGTTLVLVPSEVVVPGHGTTPGATSRS
jgi:hypothetical protein